MRATFKFLAPAADETALGVEDHHRVVPIAGRVHRVVHVDAALRVLGDAVRVAVLEAGGQFPPVVVDLIRELAAADDRPLGAGLVGCVQQRWTGRRSDQAGAERAEELSAGRT